MNYIVTAQAVRDYLELNSPGSSSVYSDGTISSNIRSAQSYLERECHRFFYDHPAVTWAKTTMLQAQVTIPGFRTITSCTWGGSTLSVAFPGDGNPGPSAWAILEESVGLEAPLAVALQFRPWRADSDRPWWLADAGWFDKSLDNPFYPGNLGGGYAWVSMPNDLVIVGDGGYAAGTEPDTLIHTVKVLASWYTMRPASVLADVSITPGAGLLAYSALPPEVVEFVADWKIGTQVQSM